LPLRINAIIKTKLSPFFARSTHSAINNNFLFYHWCHS
jgi:hypothetical protein